MLLEEQEAQFPRVLRAQENIIVRMDGECNIIITPIKSWRS